jgi:GDP-L-fucose synthase
MVIERGSPGAYNIGRSDNEVTMKEVAELACAIAGADENLIRMVSAPGNQTLVKRLSTEKIRSMGWRPEVDLEEGMRRTYQGMFNDQYSDGVQEQT